jgi:phosphoribosylglycinamide formyltransferase-1
MSEPDATRVGILLSGRGSNMAALVDAMHDGRVAAVPAVVLSNVADAPGLVAAAARGVPTAVVTHRGEPREGHENKVLERLRDHGVDWVCLAGYMRLLSARMVHSLRGRILNVHPSLLPAFPGLHAQRRALEHGVRFSGCTVHFVDEECDHGPIVLQAVVPVHDDDTEQSLSARILEQEHRVYPEAVRLYFEGRLHLEGRRVHIDPPRDG